jgi:hypothetical protein
MDVQHVRRQSDPSIPIQFAADPRTGAPTLMPPSHAELPQLIETRWFAGVFPRGVVRTEVTLPQTAIGAIKTERYEAGDSTGFFGVEVSVLPAELATAMSAAERVAFTAALAETFENALVRRMGAPLCDGYTRPLGTSEPGARRVVSFEPPGTGRVVYLKTLTTMEVVLQAFAIVPPGPEAMVAGNVFFGHLKHKLTRSARA